MFLLQTTKKRRKKAWELTSLSLALMLLPEWKEILISREDWSFRDSYQRQPYRSSTRESKGNPLAWKTLKVLGRKKGPSIYPCVCFPLYSSWQSGEDNIVPVLWNRNSKLIYRGPQLACVEASVEMHVWFQSSYSFCDNCGASGWGSVVKVETREREWQTYKSFTWLDCL